MDRARRGGLRRRPGAVLPARRRCHRRRRDLRRRPVHPAGRRQGLAVRPGRPGGRPAARALRTAGVPVHQPALRSAAQSGPGDHQAPAEPATSPPATSRAPRCSPTSPPPTGSPSITPRAACRASLPYLSELQPEFFCEVSPELAAERGLSHLGWATIITARTAIEARVMVTERIRPIQVQGRHAAPDRAAVSLGRQRHQHRRLGERPGSPRPRPERAHPGGKGAGLRHPAGAPPARARAAAAGARVRRTGGHHR